MKSSWNSWWIRMTWHSGCQTLGCIRVICSDYDRATVVKEQCWYITAATLSVNCNHSYFSVLFFFFMFLCSDNSRFKVPSGRLTCRAQTTCSSQDCQEPFWQCTISHWHCTKKELFPEVGMKLQGHSACSKTPTPTLAKTKPNQNKETTNKRNRISNTGSITPKIDACEGRHDFGPKANSNFRSLNSRQWSLR